ncbi:hypothetical protein [Nostoc sp.]|uniref:hypothetical protein n=1 Tax=Nostoc sp. TaxID=1180 RepID=UPI002FF4C5CD
MKEPSKTHPRVSKTRPRVLDFCYQQYVSKLWELLGLVQNISGCDIVQRIRGITYNFR